jgi:hypothetical protein
MFCTDSLAESRRVVRDRSAASADAADPAARDEVACDGDRRFAAGPIEGRRQGAK